MTRNYGHSPIATLIFIAIIGTIIININLSRYGIEAFYTLDSKACLIAGIVFSIINFVLYFFCFIIFKSKYISNKNISSGLNFILLVAMPPLLIAGSQLISTSWMKVFLKICIYCLVLFLMLCIYTIVKPKYFGSSKINDNLPRDTLTYGLTFDIAFTTIALFFLIFCYSIEIYPYLPSTIGGGNYKNEVLIDSKDLSQIEGRIVYYNKNFIFLKSTKNKNVVGINFDNIKSIKHNSDEVKEVKNWPNSLNHENN